MVNSKPSGQRELSRQTTCDRTLRGDTVNMYVYMIRFHSKLFLMAEVVVHLF